MAAVSENFRRAARCWCVMDQRRDYGRSIGSRARRAAATRSQRRTRRSSGGGRAMGSVAWPGVVAASTARRCSAGPLRRCVPSARRAVVRNLHRIRGPASPIRDTRDVLATFCDLRVVPRGGARQRRARRTSDARRRRRRAKHVVRAYCASGRQGHRHRHGAHGGLGNGRARSSARATGSTVMLVTHAEPNARARRLRTRRASAPAYRSRTSGRSARVAAAAPSPAARRRRRAPARSRRRPGCGRARCALLRRATPIPEGPFRLAQALGRADRPGVLRARGLSRVPRASVYEPRRSAPRNRDGNSTKSRSTSQTCMTRFLRAHPTQWFQFGG